MTGDDVAGVVEEARRLARARAAEIMADELTARYVDEARRLVGSGSRPESALWVYGVAWADATAPSRPGVGGAPVRLVVDGGLAALVSPVETALDPDDADAVGDAARAHDAVLRAAFAGTSVVPMRFGTVLRGDDVERFLRQPHLGATLAAFDGLGEWKVVVRRRQASEAAAPVGDESGAQYLSRKATGLRSSVTERVDAALQEMAVGRAGEHVLVHRDAEDRFSDRIGALQRELGPAWEVEASGPWPAFHFARLEEPG